MDRPALTVDVAAVASGSILLIQRKNDPFAGAWALPGGFVDAGEQVIVAARRELHEETGIDAGDRLRLVGVYDTPGRDPRGWSVSVVYLLHLAEPAEAHGGDDAADARWWPLAELPKLAFDHDLIVVDAVAAAR